MTWPTCSGCRASSDGQGSQLRALPPSVPPQHSPFPSTNCNFDLIIRTNPLRVRYWHERSDTQAEELTAIFNRQIRPLCLMIVKTFPHVLLPRVAKNPKACLLAQLGRCYPFFPLFVLLSSFDLSCSPEELKIGADFDSRWCFPHWIALWFFLTGSWWIWCRQRCFLFGSRRILCGASW